MHSPRATPDLQLRATCGAGQAWRAGRLNIISTSGTSEEVGYQHGVLLREEARRGAVRHLASAAHNLEGIRELPFLKRQGARLYVNSLYRKIRKDLSDEYRAEIAGLAKGLNLRSSAVLRSSFLSEILQGLVAAADFSKSEAVAKGGCTAAASLNERSGSGVIHGKNQDYDAAGYWDESPAIIITRLLGAKAYAKVTSAGLLKGNLSLNEAGLTIGGHMLFSSHSGKTGRSFTALENDVMRGAASLGEAVDTFRSTARLGCFAFVVTDSSQNRAAVVECDGDTVEVREASNGVLGMSNIYTASQKMRRRDLLIQSAFDRNPLSRQSRVDGMLANGSAAADIQRIADILADQFDPASARKRSVAHTIASVMTVTSAIAVPASNELWVGEDLAPTSIGRYIGFDLSHAFEGGEPIIVGTLDAGQRSERHARAIRCYIEARFAFEEANDPEKTIRLLHEGREFDPDESAFNRTIARLHIREKRFVLAELVLSEIDPDQATANERAEIAILRGHLADVAGSRSLALECYRQALGTTGSQHDPLMRVALPLIAIANNHLVRPFSQRDADRLAVPFSQISGIE